ncbi:hypothetical protein Taro_047727 [Colocasia esculenta]|uniref:AUGMIN subunit 2 n=1 Tax=Colocasia esculenta TaxID=4460 RepID=A0A843X803_COLES|nr:hypothetical protein [Colocasia esculenta]
MCGETPAHPMRVEPPIPAWRTPIGVCQSGPGRVWSGRTGRAAGRFEKLQGVVSHLPRRLPAPPAFAPRHHPPAAAIPLPDSPEQFSVNFFPARDRGAGNGRVEREQQMSAWTDTPTAGGLGKKPPKRVGGMAEALSIAADLGFTIPPVQEDGQNITNSSASDKNDDLIKVLRELTSVQRNIATLQVELQGRKDDKNVAHLTHVSEMEKKIESLARMTAILKDVIQNKDRIIARLQQPYSLDCIPVEAEYQKQFSDLLLKAASDYGALTASVADFQWSQNFKESPSVWGEMLRPIPAALASCTRFFEAMSAMRESFATLQQLRIGRTSLSMPSNDLSTGDSKFMTPPQWREEISSDDSVPGSWKTHEKVNRAEGEDADDGANQRRLSWPPPIKRSV